MNQNTNYYVKNIRGTSTHRRLGQTWTEYYVEQTGSRATRCCVIGCGGSFDVGAHVQIQDGRVDKGWYIVPFCSSCNHHTNTDIMAIKRSTILVPATIN